MKTFIEHGACNRLILYFYIYQIFTFLLFKTSIYVSWNWKRLKEGGNLRTLFTRSSPFIASNSLLKDRESVFRTVYVISRNYNWFGVQPRHNFPHAAAHTEKYLLTSTFPWFYYLFIDRTIYPLAGQLSALVQKVRETALKSQAACTLVVSNTNVDPCVCTDPRSLSDPRRQGWWER